MDAKAIARNKKTNKFQWYTDVFTDGDTVYLDTKQGMRPLRGFIELWVRLSDNDDYILVIQNEMDEHDKKMMKEDND